MDFTYTQRHVFNGIEYIIYHQNKQLTWGDVLYLANYKPFIQLLVLLLKQYSQPFFWELPPVIPQRMNNIKFSMVLINMDEPIPEEDHHTYGPYIEQTEDSVHLFWSAYDDVLLFIPTRKYPHTNTVYTNIYTFVQSASLDELIDYYTKLFEVLRDIIFPEYPQTWLWVSTSGLGVFWLHTRVEFWPKHYRHIDYVRTS